MSSGTLFDGVRHKEIALTSASADFLFRSPLLNDALLVGEVPIAFRNPREDIRRSWVFRSRKGLEG